MPTNRTRRARRKRELPVSPEAYAIMSEQQLPDDHNPFEALDYEYPSCKQKLCRTEWEKVKEMILDNWIKLKPGTRPKYWWVFDAPEAERKRLGGAGETLPSLCHEGNLRANRGLPSAWWFRDSFDPSDPPIFESQATYLARHDLFLPGEMDRLNNDAFSPERLKPTR